MQTPQKDKIAKKYAVEHTRFALFAWPPSADDIRKCEEKWSLLPDAPESIADYIKEHLMDHYQKSLLKLINEVRNEGDTVEYAISKGPGTILFPYVPKPKK